MVYRVVAGSQCSGGRGDYDDTPPVVCPACQSQCQLFNDAVVHGAEVLSRELFFSFIYTK